MIWKLTYLKVQIVRKRKLDKMTISNFERLSGDIVQRDMSLVWWAGITIIFSCINLFYTFFLHGHEMCVLTTQVNSNTQHIVSPAQLYIVFNVLAQYTAT